MDHKNECVAFAWRGGVEMEQSSEFLTRRLLKTSVDLRDLLAEVSALREAVRAAEIETARRNQSVAHPVAVAPSAPMELRA
jgi:hypothetical protein